MARQTPADVDRLLDYTSIIRNRRKLEATVDSAVEMLALEEESGLQALSALARRLGLVCSAGPTSAARRRPTV